MQKTKSQFSFAFVSFIFVNLRASNSRKLVLHTWLLCRYSHLTKIFYWHLIVSSKEKMCFVIRFVAFFSFVSSCRGTNQPVPCPNNRLQQKISCAPGQALSELTWVEDVSNCGKIHVECKNATSSCVEVKY